MPAAHIRRVVDSRDIPMLTAWCNLGPECRQKFDSEKAWKFQQPTKHWNILGMLQAKQLHWKFIHDPNRLQTCGLELRHATCYDPSILSKKAVLCFQSVSPVEAPGGLRRQL